RHRRRDEDDSEQSAPHVPPLVGPAATFAPALRRPRKPDTTMPLAAVLDLAAARRQYQFDDFLGHLRFETFGVSLVQTNDIGDDAPVPAFLIREDVGLARTRPESPRLRAGILPRAVEHVAGLRIHDLAALGIRRARVLLRARRCLRQLAAPMLPGLEDVREVTLGRRRNHQCARGRTRRWRRTPNRCGSGLCGNAKACGASGLAADTTAGETQEAIDLRREEVAADNARGCQTALRMSGEPEGLDVPSADRLDDRRHDV